MTVPSYERINYSVRPAKHVERLMMLEALQRLRVFAPLETYRYIGLGSIHFVDFKLFHRSLGIHRMISIEEDEHNRARFNFNRPFRSVKLMFGHSTSVLPELKWSTRSVVWLDYDGRLDQTVLSDIYLTCSKARSGSVILITVNAQPTPFDKEKPNRRVERLRSDVGGSNVPNDVNKDAQLSDWGLADVCRTIMDSSIRKAVEDRATQGDRFSYRQLFNFQYRDGSRMTTVGGVLLDDRDLERFEHGAFDELKYLRDGDDAYEINVPSLTHREMRHLDRELPLRPKGTIPKFIPVADCEAYAENYRFFPAFADADL